MHTEHPLHLPPISGRNSVDTRILVISSSSPEAAVAVVAAALAKAVHLGPKDTFIRDHLHRHPELQACKIHQKVASRMSSDRLADTDWR
jgi:hypothetical protein